MNKPLVRRLGNTIRHYRYKAQWTQEELAEYADVHRNYISRVESGLIDISVSGLAKIAKAFNLTLCQILESTPQDRHFRKVTKS